MSKQLPGWDIAVPCIGPNSGVNAARGILDTINIEVYAWDRQGRCHIARAEMKPSSMRELAMYLIKTANEIEGISNE